MKEGARLAHVNLPNWARQLLPPARELGLTVACDLQDVVDPADPCRRDFVDAADVVFCPAANHEPEHLVGELWARRPGLIVVVGMGARGCALGVAGQVRRFPPVRDERPVVDTNGATDHGRGARRAVPRLEERLTSSGASSRFRA